MFSDFLRKKISSHFTGQREIGFQNKVPGDDLIGGNLQSIDALGIYLHIPFCNQICPYCPYNKEIYSEEACQKYVTAVKKEIDFYAPMLRNKPVSNLYVGGGTPTTMVGKGMEEMISHLYKRLNMQCQIHMESHPNHLTHENLNSLEAMGVKYLSIGVEALQDRHLRAIERPYTVREVKRSVERAVGRNFECVNIDYIFDLPGQTESEVEQAAHGMVGLGIQQVATYPLFRFPYTRMGRKIHEQGNGVATMFRRRKLLKILEQIFYDSGFERSSVWAFTKRGVDKYCSVTVPSYVGIGASGGSFLRNIFYVNTFNVGEYIRAFEKRVSPIALSIELSEEMQMAGWLYWRIYETKFNKRDFNDRFDACFDKKYGIHMKILNKLGFLKNGNDEITLTDRGTYWIHAFEDFFSIDYISKLWGTSTTNSWPERVIL